MNIVVVLVSLLSQVSLFTHADSVCGRRNLVHVDGRAVMKPIVGGKVTHKNEFPWQIALRIQSNDIWSLHCGATLLTPRWILTAAHCFRNPYPLEMYQIVAGAQNIAQPENSTQLRKLKRYILHSQWNETLLINDIALIEIDEALKLSQSSAAPACLPDENGSDDDSENCFATGWGARGMEDGTPTYHEENVLYMSKIPLVPRAECEARYIKRYGIKISPNQLCAGRSKESGTCVGDSGGPLSCESEGSYKVIGVTSFGGRLCNTNVFPDVFTKVSSYRKWIEENIAQNYDS